MNRPDPSRTGVPRSVFALPGCFSVAALVVALVGLGPAAQAAVEFNWSGSQEIPDNNPGGVSYAFNYDNSGHTSIESVTVSFNISGGWNGDLYAYLSHGSGFAVLLNRVGTVNEGDVGYEDSGFNLVLKSTGATYGDIHTYQNVSGYATHILDGSSWQADGRINYTDTARNNTLAVFNGMNPNGDWTLFFADMSVGDTSTLLSWNVSITAPEPVNVALGVFAAVAGLTAFVRSRLRGARHVLRQPRYLPALQP